MIDKLKIRAEVFAEIINLVNEELLSINSLILDAESKYYLTGKKHTLEKILTQIKFLERFPIADHALDMVKVVDIDTNLNEDKS